MAWIKIGVGGNDFTFEIPPDGTSDWGQGIRTLFLNKLRDHDHSGSGRGAKLGSGSLEDNAVTTAKINNKAVDSDKLADSLTINELAIPPSDDVTSPEDGQLMVSDGTDRDKGLWLYQDGVWVSVQGEVGVDSVNTVAIQNNAVTLDKMANNSVSTDEIVDNSITNAKMANDSVDTAELVDGAVTKEKLSTAIFNTTSYDTSSSSSSFTGATIELTVTTTRPVLISVSGLYNYGTGTTFNAQVNLSNSSVTTSGVVVSRTITGGLATVSSVMGMPISGMAIFTPTVGLNTFYVHYNNGVGGTTLSTTGNLIAIQL